MTLLFLLCIAAEFFFLLWVASIYHGSLERFLCAIFKTREIHKPEGLYLRRFYLSPRVRWLPFQIFLHNIRLDDSRDMHDHPWSFVTIILRGGYREIVRCDCPNTIHDAPAYWPAEGPHKYMRTTHPGSVLLNRAEHTHRVEIIRPVWSLVIASRPRRHWGFWEDGVDHRGDPVSTWTPADEFLNDPTVYDWPEDRL